MNDDYIDVSSHTSLLNVLLSSIFKKIIGKKAYYFSYKSIFEGSRSDELMFLI